MNQIGSVTVSTTRPIIFDPYLENRSTGSFVLIDEATNVIDDLVIPDPPEGESDTDYPD